MIGTGLCFGVVVFHVYGLPLPLRIVDVPKLDGGFLMVTVCIPIQALRGIQFALVDTSTYCTDVAQEVVSVVCVGPEIASRLIPKGGTQSAWDVTSVSIHIPLPSCGICHGSEGATLST